ncbi:MULTISPECIES: SusD/RagB family nutrient-binding outer membrane lipoprotein [Phocaeicola]|uniref:SusD/RagB family nutrient-binding outer membrane lipoprotein n=1 Tax=Phocaeicola vulgatus TaxID=821 RepID=A0A415BJ58_PHOVU|nr:MULTISPECIES: SusD/RagB family nutrient-binding outer membrane lipoprotein [Phocaeicola]MCB7017810.1 SusD/RagB family nutrient-binding outer membrane lipoprotein [Phocaeicola vulgatus]MCG4687090.1 SusD/RagB family nutrient-binding outer membrane lipoprotein [Phocaeicola vulgatus]MCG4728135.1 SusD/RagB family nutrient-binding outer membrane lipoprotein [Phocaeicola vulgatus]NMX17661.1 SusD/RagB family nutrient-binding outer membrane lipoprotein [Phocaeicola vulgatus]RHI85635.1 SusD/RagB fami
MKTMNKLFLGLGFCAGLVSCSDFDEVNTNPTAAGEEYVKPQYALNNSIGQAQMNPGTAERIVVYNWASAARICGEMSFLNVGRYSDDYTSAYYYPDLSASIKNATLAITAVENQLEAATTTAHEKEFFPNVKQFARIWRAYLISEFVDNFGPYPIESFLGENPVFNSEKDDYEFILKELKEAAAAINTSVLPVEAEGKCDPFDNVKYDPVKWQKYANSLRMRLAMRLSNIDKATAQAEFEDAAKGNKILTADDMFAVKENDGWDVFSGVYTRSFDDQVLSSTVANLLTNLGGIKVTEQRSDLASYVKPANYLGIKYDRHYVANTDNPTKQYWLDGMPENLDPRALKIFCLPDDENAENYIDKYNDRTAKDFVLYTVDENGNPIPNKDNPGEIKIDATRCWNGYPAGSRGGWSPTLAYNQLVTNGYGPGCTLPMLGKDYCKGKSRIFFAAWETYFLLAEASLYGWNTGTTAKEAYENGIKASFEYFGVSEYVNDYLNSTNYNRVGTSVKFDHTTEPTAEQMTYVDGYSKEQKTVTYEYPTASKTLYGKALNDHLTKIITQKFIAQTPYLVLEMWSDFRRLGLPFFEIPANESSMTGSDMVNAWNPNSWKDGQKWEFYPQRMRYPSSLENADPEGYKQAVELLGGSDNIITPLWWTGR